MEPTDWLVVAGLAIVIAGSLCYLFHYLGRQVGFEDGYNDGEQVGYVEGYLEGRRMTSNLTGNARARNTILRSQTTMEYPNVKRIEKTRQDGLESLLDGEDTHNPYI